MKIAFRADASLQIGTGHVMRCLTLADALTARGAECHFICREHEGNLIGLIGQRGYKTHVLSNIVDEQGDGARSRSFLGKIQPAWTIVDHYALGAKWEKAVNVRLMVIDDLANRNHVCELLLDQNLGRKAADYATLVPPEAEILAGPHFALVRPEFVAARKPESESLKNNWLACVGGIDPKDILSKIVTAWEMLTNPKPSLTLAVGADSPNVPALAKRVASLPGVTLHVQATNMAELMAKADLLIGTTGSMSWERCCVGLPSIMGTVAENQRENLEALLRQCTGLSVGDWESVSSEKLAALLDGIRHHPEALAKMGTEARQVVDGKGTARVAICLMREQITLRKATLDDAELVFPWRNAPSTRRHFFNPEAIAPETHIAWWRQSIGSEERNLLIAEIKKIPVGVLRFDHADKESVVSIYIDPDFTGLGLGAAILEAGRSWCRNEYPRIKRLLAEILPENKASLSAFRKAGFAPHSGKWVVGL